METPVSVVGRLDFVQASIRQGQSTSDDFSFQSVSVSTSLQKLVTFDSLSKSVSVHIGRAVFRVFPDPLTPETDSVSSYGTRIRHRRLSDIPRGLFGTNSVLIKSQTSSVI